MICPFFGQNEDYCDVGCGYISPSDVKKIIQFCSTHPDRCPAFQYLLERHPEVAAQPSRADAYPAGPNSVPLSPPAPANATVGAATRETGHPSVAEKTVPGSPPADADPLINPAPSGLLAFGLTTALFSLHHTGHFPLADTMLGMGVLYGGISQIVVGFIEWKRHNVFGATTFTSLGLFWLSLIAMAIFSGSGFGQIPRDTAMAGYLVLWGFFSLVLFIGALRLNRSLQLVLGLLILHYFLLAASIATDSRFLFTCAGWDGILCASSAIYTGIAQILNEILGRSVVPLGEHKRPVPSVIQKQLF